MVIFCLDCLGGCTKQADWPDIIVSASTPGEFAQFRAGLGQRFKAEQLQLLDTATQELQLDAMNRDVNTAEARELDMLKVVNGQPVRTVLHLGWQARKARFLREIAEFNQMLERDLPQKEKSEAARRIQSEQEVLGQLQAKLAETERRLAEWGQASPRSSD